MEIRVVDIIIQDNFDFTRLCRIAEAIIRRQSRRQLKIELKS